MKIVVTGGAGFIGSHLTDALARNGNEVIVIDNLSAGKKENVARDAEFIAKDILKESIVQELAGTDAVFHLAADPDVRASAERPAKSFELNAIATFRLLESCRKGGVKHVVFTSTSVVYGDAETVPTPENYPCTPISNYGASKLACEAYCSSYANSYGIKATVMRYANIFGERSNHGVMYDFFHKLKKNPKELEILGDGNQDKSYLHVEDCVSATLAAFEKQEKIYDVFNVGSSEKQKVKKIAEIVCGGMKLKPKFRYTGGERGWVGDVKLMLLDTKKIRSLGWKQNVSLEEGINRYVKWLSKQ
ncbi:NAD-dependent epimerase/dehydratase family protein [Candidatus Micrarchaeota archaeon]|nr:NAD-dependent epimerase/dehydratase family protein [Candidatus Micrarchaeota archaeon]